MSKGLEKKIEKNFRELIPKLKEFQLHRRKGHSKTISARELPTLLHDYSGRYQDELRKIRITEKLLRPVIIKFEKAGLIKIIPWFGCEEAQLCPCNKTCSGYEVKII